MKIYTKSGDDGSTGLLSNRRVGKDDPRIEAYGTVDELNAVLGIARAEGLDAASDAHIRQVQDDLFAVGSALADPNPDGPFHAAVTAEHAGRLERWIDAMEAELPPSPGSSSPAGPPRRRSSTWRGPSAGAPSAWSWGWATSPASTSRGSC